MPLLNGSELTVEVTVTRIVVVIVDVLVVLLSDHVLIDIRP